VIAGTDSVSVAALIAATTPIPSSGDVLTDLAALLAVVPSGASSRLFFRDRAFASKDSCDASRRERRGLPTAERQWRIGDKPAPLKAKRPRRLLLVKPPPKR